MSRKLLASVVVGALSAGCGGPTVASHPSSATGTSGGSGTSGASHGASSGSTHGSSGTGSSGSTGHATGSGGSVGTTGTTAGHGPLTGLVVTPNPAVVDLYAGAGSATLTATASYADGTQTHVSPSWAFDQRDLGHIDGSGTFTATGARGGQGTATASYGGLSATATVQLIVHVIQNPAGLTTTQQYAFDAPDAAPSGALLYPQDQTVFARGLPAPDVMWSGGAAGDVYRVRVSEALFDATLYVAADPPSVATLPQDVWDALTQSNAGEPVTLEVTRETSGAAHAPMTETWQVAQGSLRGSIYYWAVNQGQLMKIAPGSPTPTPMFDPGPSDDLGTPAPANYDGTVPPWTAAGTHRCVACHTVSKDGSTAVAIFERQDDASSPWGTIDLSSPTPGVVQISSYDRRVDFLGLSPTGKYAVENQSDFSMHLYDAASGALIQSALDALTQSADPSFSPDGHAIAFASNTVGSYPIEYGSADLSVMDFDPVNALFSNARTVVPGTGGAVAFPSFSPDSAWVYYQYGDFSRAKYGNNQVGQDDLYLADVAAAAGPTLLATASGAGLDPRNQHLAYQPTVNPISVGGYNWVVFVSPRDYGNKMQAQATPGLENRKQLWVAAVDAHPQPGVDPSHPAFWLPGQDLTTINMSGYWALEACHQTGGGCSQGFECCSGYCDPDPDGGAGTCATGPTGTGCSQIGDACTTAAQCCDTTTAECLGGYCTLRLR